MIGRVRVFIVFACSFLVSLSSLFSQSQWRYPLQSDLELNRLSVQSSRTNLAGDYGLLGTLYFGPCAAIGVSDRWAALTNGPSVKVFDVEDADSLRLVHELVTSIGIAGDILIRDSLIFLCSADSIRIMRISSPDRLDLVSVVVIPGYPNALQVSDSILYTVTYGGKLFVINIADISHPQIRNSRFVASPKRSSFAAEGRTIFVTEGDDRRLTVVDATDLDSLKVSYIPLPYLVSAAALHDSILVLGCVATDGAGVFLYRISSPGGLRKIAALDIRADALSVSGHILITAEGDSLTTFDISIPESPLRIDAASVASSVDRAVIGPIRMVSSETRVITNYPTGAYITAIDSAGRLDRGSFYHTGDLTLDVFVQDTLALLAANNAGLWIASIADPSKPRLLSHVYLHGRTCGVAAEGAIAVAVNFAHGENDTSFGLWTIDLTDPCRPQVLARHKGILGDSRDGQLNRVIIRDRTVYLTQGGGYGHNVLEMVDVSDPRQPRSLDSLRGGYSCSDLGLGETQVLLASPDSGLIVADISDRSNAREVFRLAVPACAVTCHDSMAYVACTDLSVFGLAAEQAPTILGTTPIHYGVSRMHISLDGEVLYWAGGWAAGAIDIRSPTAPKIVTTFAVDIPARDIAASSNSILIALDFYGIALWSKTVTALPEVSDRTADSPYLAENFPNPFNAATTIEFGLPASQHVKLEVFDVLGRRVGTLVNQVLEAGKHSARLTGESLPSGMYFVRLTCGNTDITRKALLLR